MTDLYHMTHIRNLQSILTGGGLHCDAAMYGIPIDAVGIAHEDLKRRRAEREIPIVPGRVVADYVPFYFSPRSPMLFAIYRGNVQHYREGQAPLVYLVTSVERVVAEPLEWVFTDGGAEHYKTRFFIRTSDLNKLDWTLLRARQWSDTREDNDRVRRRRAEFLVYGFLPWSLVTHIGVINGTM